MVEKGWEVMDAWKNKRRMFTIIILLTLIWGGLLGRLLWIQVIDTRTFSSHKVDLIDRSVNQRQRQIVLNSGRGAILDRNGIPFTGTTIYSVVVFPLKQYPFAKDPKMNDLARLLHLSQQSLVNQVSKMKVPSVVTEEATKKQLEVDEKTANQINDLNIAGIRAMPYNRRYPQDSVARQVIGYIAKNPEFVKKAYADELAQGLLTENSLIGVSGLERGFQPFLQGLGPTEVSYFVDAAGNPLRGLQIRYNAPDNPYYPLSLVTTLDKEIQTKAEQIIDQNGISKGAAVILDAENGDILAMVSRPNFNPESVDPNQGGWSNLAVKQTVPGSIFKTVVSAAALESGQFKPDDTFFCSGELGKYGFSCWKKGGHGEITLKEAFAQSCNIAYAKIAMKLGNAKIEEYANKLGLLQQVGWQTDQLFKIPSFHQIIGEDKGQVYSAATPKNDEGVLVQTSIGQRDVRLSPLQAANLVVTLLNGGKAISPRLVKEIQYRNGTPFYKFAPQALPTGSSISPLTANEILDWMKLVVSDGTGKTLQSTKWPVAGKSGTAQVIVKGEERNNHWFIGYGPTDHPRYAIAVVEEDTPVNEIGGGKAKKAFGEMMDALAVLNGE